MPLLLKCIGNIECQLWNTYDGGDHYIFVGEVVAALPMRASKTAGCLIKIGNTSLCIILKEIIVAGLKATVLKGKEDKLEIKKKNLP